MNRLLYSLIILISACSNDTLFESFDNDDGVIFIETVRPLALPTSTKPQPYTIVHEKTFRQSWGKRPLDIAIGIDNSLSMDPFIDQINANIVEFFEELDKEGYEYRVGVLRTTIDEYSDDILLQGPYPIVNHDDANHIERINANIESTKYNDRFNEEAPISTFQARLEFDAEEDLIPRFFRFGDHDLVMISLSDFDEVATYGGYVHWEIDDEDSYEPAINDIIRIFNSYYERWQMIYIGSPPDNHCPEAEIRYHRETALLMAETGGVMGRICDDNYSDVLINGLEKIYDLKNSFSLGLEFSSKLLLQDTIEVTVENQQVPQNNQDGFSFFSLKKNIEFHGSYIPGEGEEIKVKFDELYK